MVFAKHAIHLVRDDMPTMALSRSILLGRKTTCVDLASRSITSFPRSHHYPQMFLRLPKSLRGKRRECAGGNKRRIRGARIFTPESTVVHCRPVLAASQACVSTWARGWVHEARPRHAVIA